jgi:hypothetical protein
MTDKLLLALIFAIFAGVLAAVFYGASRWDADYRERCAAANGVARITRDGPICLRRDAVIEVGK